jgi:hypothetical protein
MIARPLDLASRLSPQPRSFDSLFYVNICALVLFFFSFGSRFVLAPGLVLGGDALAVEGTRTGAVKTTSSLRILSGGQMFTDDGLLEQGGLKRWLGEQVQKAKSKPDSMSNRAVLLLIAEPHVTLDELARLYSLAKSAGFDDCVIAANNASPAASGH